MNYLFYTKFRRRTKMTKEFNKKDWEDGWEKGFSDGYKKAIEELVYILEQGNLNKIYEKEYKK